MASLFVSLTGMSGATGSAEDPIAPLLLFQRGLTTRVRWGRVKIKAVGLEIDISCSSSQR